MRKIIKNKKKIIPILIIILILLIVFVIPIRNNKSIFNSLISNKNFNELTAERQELYDKMKIEYINIKNRVTGTEPFNDGETSDSNGVDVTANDNYVRTFDVMKYTVEVGIEPNTDHEGVTSSSVFEGGVIKVRAKLPNQGNPTLMRWEQDAWMQNVSYSNDNTEIYAEYHAPEGTTITNANQNLTFTVKVDGYKKEVTSEMAPEFEFWMEGNKPDDSSSAANSVTKKDENTTIISGKVNLDTAIVKSTNRNFRGLKDGITGQYMNFGFLVSILQPISSFSDLRGVEFPSGDVEIDVESTYSYRNRNSSTDWSTVTDSSNVAILAYGLNKENKDGYYLTSHNYMEGIPCGRIDLHSQEKYCVYDSGVFSLNFENNNYQTKFTNYEINSSKFPTRNMGSVTDSSATNIGKFLAGNTQVFVPYYDFDSDITYDYEYKMEIKTIKYKDTNGNSYVVNGDDETRVTNNVTTNTFSNALSNNINTRVRLYSGNSHDSEESSAIIGAKVTPLFQVGTIDGPYAGGAIRYITWNSAFLTFDNKIATSCSSEMGFTCPTFKGVTYQYGILKSSPETGLTTTAAINASKPEDFDWYSTTAEALTHGKIAAIKVDDPVPTELGMKRFIKPTFVVDDNEDNIGKVAIFYQKASVFEDAARTKEIKLSATATFKDAQYNANGTLKRSSSPRAIGASLLIIGARARTQTTVSDTDNFGNTKQAYDVQDGEVHIVVTPTLESGSEQTDNDIIANNVIVRNTLPVGLTYKAGSANKEPKSVTINPNGTTTIEWEYTSWQVNRPAPETPEITFTAEISSSLDNNSSLLMTSNMFTDLDLSDDSRLEANYKYSEYGIIISNLAGSKTIKNIDKPVIDKNGNFTITNTLGNNSDETLTDVRTIELLPKNNDDKGTKYNGTYAGTILSKIPNQRFFYTTNSIDNIGLTNDRNGKITIKEVDLPNDSRWIEINVGDSIPNNATALATTLPSLEPQTESSFSLGFVTNGNQKNNTYIFAHNMTSNNLEVAVKSNTVIVEVVERTISGIAFEDVDRNNQYNEGDKLLKAITAELLDSTNTKIDETTTNTDGYYSFSLPDKGDYYVKFTSKDGYELITKGTSETSSKVNSNYVTDIIDHTAEPQTVIEEKANYNLGIRKKEATLIVHHYEKDTTNSLSPDEVSTVYYTDTYETNKLDPIPTNYVFSSNDKDPTTGTVDKDNIEVIYYYDHIPATLKVLYLDESNNNIDSTKNINDNTKHMGDPYSTVQLTFANYDFLRVEGDPVSGTMDKEEVEVKYIYKLKKGTVTTHHYLYENGTETTTSLAPDVTNTYNYTETYNTEVSNEVPKNYEFFRKTDNFTGTVSSPNTEVNYYYQLKDSNLETTITKTGTEEITKKDKNVEYHINYTAKVKDYIGNATITMTEQLPHPIDVSKSELDGGTYNPNNQTITWTISWNNINTYEETNQTAIKNIKKNLNLVYEGIDARDRLITSSTSVTINLANKSRDSEAIIPTNIKIPGKVIVKYIDKEGNEIANQDKKEGLVGETTTTSSIDIEGYKLIELPTTENYEFEEEDQIVIYKYEKIVLDITTEVEGEGGTIEGDETVPYGESSTKDKIVIKAKEGFVVSKVLIDDKEITIKENQTEIILDNFINVKDNHHIKVSFLPYNPETSSNGKNILIITFILSIVSVFLVKFKKIHLKVITKKF